MADNDRPPCGCRPDIHRPDVPHWRHADERWKRHNDRLLDRAIEARNTLGIVGWSREERARLAVRRGHLEREAS